MASISYQEILRVEELASVIALEGGELEPDALVEQFLAAGVSLETLAYMDGQCIQGGTSAYRKVLYLLGHGVSLRLRAQD